ncbi:hypothetical protein Q9233_016898, partial [Columba guinea]
CSQCQTSAQTLLGGHPGQRLQPHHGHHAEEELRGVVAGQAGEEKRQHHRALQERSGVASGGGERAEVGPGHPGAQRSAPLAAEGPGEPQ